MYRRSVNVSLNFVLRARKSKSQLSLVASTNSTRSPCFRRFPFSPHCTNSTCLSLRATSRLYDSSMLILRQPIQFVFITIFSVLLFHYIFLICYLSFFSLSVSSSFLSLPTQHSFIPSRMNLQTARKGRELWGWLGRNQGIKEEVVVSSLEKQPNSRLLQT